MSYVINWTAYDGARFHRAVSTLYIAIYLADLLFRCGATEVSVWGGNGTDECPSECLYRIEASF